MISGRAGLSALVLAMLAPAAIVAEGPAAADLLGQAVYAEVLAGGKAVFVIRDEGPGFDPKIVPDPTTDENLEKPNGRGIMLMRAYMDEIRYNAQGNQVRIVKRNT